MFFSYQRILFYSENERFSSLVFKRESFITKLLDITKLLLFLYDFYFKNQLVNQLLKLYHIKKKSLINDFS